MKRVLGILTVIAILSAVPGCNKKQEPAQAETAKTEAAKVEDDYVFKIGSSVSLCGSPVRLAIQKGYYEEEGLKVEPVQVGDGDAMNLLTNGSIDGVNFMMVGLIQPLSNGLPVQIPLALHTGCIKALVREDSDIRTAVDLKGKKIGGAGPGASGILFIKRYLTGKGLKADGENADVEYIYQSAAELPLLIERGIVEAIVLSEPAAQITQDAHGFRAIIDNAADEAYKDEFCCVVSVRSETVKAHPEATAKFLRAVQKAAKFVQEYPDEAAQILADTKQVAGDPLVNARVLKTFNYRASVSQVLPALERNAKDMQALGILKAEVDVDKLVQDVFIAVPGVPDSLF